MSARLGRYSIDAKPADAVRGYYGIPVIHRPHWKWLIIWYFFFGGISGAAAVIGSMARLRGGRNNAHIARIAVYLSGVALAPCPAFLILDLGRPGRFINMLRAFRPTSPMSMGTWILTSYSAITTLAAGAQYLLDRGHLGSSRARRTGAKALRMVAPLHAVLGFGVAGYTGVLLVSTAVPLWSRRPWLLGPLFLSSAMTSGAAGVIAAAAIAAPKVSTEGVHRIEVIASIVETTLLGAWTFSLGPTSKAIAEGHVGVVLRLGAVGTGVVAPAALAALAQRLPLRLRRIASVASSILTLVGVLALRYAIVEGGRMSADDPQATFDLTG